MMDQEDVNAALEQATKKPTTAHYDDVYEFHEKFKLMAGTRPRRLTKRKLLERVEFMQEELNEFIEACGIDKGTWAINNELQSLTGQADALVDLVYVALGTAVMMGLPWQELWNDVQRANMAKVRGISHRGHAVDCVKPEGWVGPKTGEILVSYGWKPGDLTCHDDCEENGND